MFAKDSNATPGEEAAAASSSATGAERGHEAVDIKQLGLTSGTWVVANCGKFPSEKNCKLVMMAPQRQRQDLIEAASTHAIKSHGHKDAPELRKELDQFLDVVEV
jgi:hypothetical protein